MTPVEALNVCIACLGWCPDPPPFDTGERLRDCVWEEPGDNGETRCLRGWICTECYVVHWAWGVEKER